MARRHRAAELLPFGPHLTWRRGPGARPRGGRGSRWSVAGRPGAGPCRAGPHTGRTGWWPAVSGRETLWNHPQSATVHGPASTHRWRPGNP